MSSLDTIRRFPYCQKVLPATYDDSLSYYESICKLVTKMNEIITELNAIDPESILELVDDRVDERLVDLNKQMQNLTDRVNQVMGSVTSALEKYNNEVTMEMHRQLTEMTVLLSTQLAALRLYVNNQDNMILSELRYQIELLKNQLPDLTTVYVYSPFSSQIVDIQTAINEIWDNIKVYSLTADEYDDMKWTAEQYDGFQLTAYQYDYYSRRFIWKDPNFYMTDVWTGEQIHTKEELDKLATLHKENSFKAGQYDALAFTCKQYELNGITAEEYDWNSINYFTLYAPVMDNLYSMLGRSYKIVKTNKKLEVFTCSYSLKFNISITLKQDIPTLSTGTPLLIYFGSTSQPYIQVDIYKKEDSSLFTTVTNKSEPYTLIDINDGETVLQYDVKCIGDNSTSKPAILYPLIAQKLNWRCIH